MKNGNEENILIIPKQLNWELIKNVFNIIPIPDNKDTIKIQRKNLFNLLFSKKEVLYLIHSAKREKNNTQK